MPESTPRPTLLTRPEAPADQPSAAGTPPDVFWNRVRTSQVVIRRDGSLVDLLLLMKRDKLTREERCDAWRSLRGMLSGVG